jgi:hypothetical protein
MRKLSIKEGNQMMERNNLSPYEHEKQILVLIPLEIEDHDI